MRPSRCPPRDAPPEVERGRIRRRRRLIRPVRPALTAALLVTLAGCRVSGKGDAATRTPEGAGPETPSPQASVVSGDRVVLGAEALRLAGVVTEVARARPFVTTLALPARLSATAETREEIEARLAFRSAAAREQRAGREYDRARRLAAGEIVADSALQAAEADAKETRVERERAEVALRNLGLDDGHEITPPRADIWAHADLFGPQAPLVRPRAPAIIRSESCPGESFEARVVSLARFLEPRTRTLTARLAVEDPRHRLRPQDSVVAEIEVDRKTAITVPDTALLYDGLERVLFVARDAGFEKVRVRAGASREGRTEILAGLGEGDVVVTTGGLFLMGEIGRIRAPDASEED
jgi:HlyD family secretion protein